MKFSILPADEDNNPYIIVLLKGDGGSKEPKSIDNMFRTLSGNSV